MRVLSLLALAIALTVLACGQQAQQASTGGGSSQPKAGGILVDHVTEQVEELDLTMAQQGGINFVAYRAYDSLLHVKTSPDLGWSDLVIEPWLAERWEVSPDAKTYTFYM